MEKLTNFEAKEAQEQYTSKIKLSFFRHGEKEKDKEKSDFDIELTKDGKKQAMEKSATKNIEQSVAFGSPRKRAQETATFVMMGDEEEITGEETIDELKEKIDKELKFGSKVGVDKRLDFILDLDSEFGKISLEHFKKSEFLKFLVEQSDEIYKKLGDENNFTYSKAAANVAGIVDKYLQIAPKWNDLVKNEKNRYSDTMERFFGTHQGVSECFLAKVIGKVEGIKKRDEFVRVLDDEGFGFVEGFNVEILNKGAESPTIHINYKKEKDSKIIFKFNKNVSQSIIKEIIDEK